MYQVNQITTAALQNQTLTLPDGSLIQTQLYFVPMQYGWFIDISYGANFTINNLRICNSPNMLRQWQNIIPFGLACFSTNDREPSQQADFFSQASILYVLTEAEVQAYSDFLSG
jgi:hypothetical protein